MTLASMHPMFQVSIDFYNHSSPNYVCKISVHVWLCLPSWSCSQCRVKVAEFKLQELLEFGSVCKSAKIRVHLNFICRLQPLYFVTCNFWRSLHYDWWKLCKAHFCKVPPPQKKIKNHLTGVEDFNSEYWFSPFIGWGRGAAIWVSIDSICALGQHLLEALLVPNFWAFYHSWYR